MGSVLDIAKALDAYGPALVLLAGLIAMNGFFVWRDFCRETRQQKQIDELQRVHNEVTIPLLTSCREVIAGCKEVINQNSQIIQSWLYKHGG